VNARALARWLTAAEAEWEPCSVASPWVGPGAWPQRIAIEQLDAFATASAAGGQR